MKKWCNDAWNWHLAVWADRLLRPQSFWIGAVGFFTNFFYLHVFVFKKFFYSCLPTHTHWLELCQKCAQENCFRSSLFYSFLAVVPKSKGKRIEMIMKIVLIIMKLVFLCESDIVHIGCVVVPWHFEFYILKCKKFKM